MMATMSTTPACAQTHFAAVVFDMDGVLVHSAPCHSAAFEKVLLENFGIDDFEYAPWAGQRTRDVIEAVLASKGIQASPEAIAVAATEKTRIALELIESSQATVTGVREVLCDLAEHGFVLALASSGSPQSVRSFLKTSSTEEIFRSVLTGGDVRKAKPDPEIYARTFERIGVDPHSCLVVEDAVSGVIAAIKAGASVVGVAGTCSEADLLAAGALTVLPNITELPGWLKNFYAAS
jgi:beta-phosphoglucomutase